MKFSKIVVALLVSAIVFTGCGGDDDKDTSNRDGSPQSNEQNSQNQQNIEEQESNERISGVTTNRGKKLWEYSLDKKGTASNVVAIDEQNNVYFAENSQVDFDSNDATFTVTSLDKNGKKRWSRTFQKAVGDPKVMYRKGHLFFVINQSTAQLNIAEKLDIYSLNASTGETIWQKEEQGFNFSFLYNHTALTDTTFYLYMLNSDIFSGSSQLVSYDANSGEKKAFYQMGDSEHISTAQISIIRMSLFDNHIYFVDSKNVVHRVDDMGDSLVENWSLKVELDDLEHVFDIRNEHDLAIDSKENIYLPSVIYGKKDVIRSISKNGQQNWKYTIESSRASKVNAITIDSNDNLYSITTGSALVVDKERLSSYLYSLSSSNGEERWRLEGGYYDDTKILRLEYQDAPTLGANGSSYHKTAYGLASVTKGGSFSWREQLKNGDNAILSSFSAMDYKGDIIAIGMSEKMVCYKGDDSSIDTKGWSKIYGNAGNTSSR